MKKEIEVEKRLKERTEYRREEEKEAKEKGN